jgi:predicted permease
MRFFWSRRRIDADAAEELQAHLELLTERNIAKGMTPVDARAAAQRQMGNTTLVREDIHEMNGVRWLDNLARDTRYAWRQIARHRVFAMVVITTMALGIGANTAILSVAYSVLMKPLPYASPDEIYSVNIIVPERREQIPSLPATVQVFLAWQKHNTAFTSMTAMTPWEASVTGGGEPERLGGAQVAANFFAFLGVPIAQGRGFSNEESRPGNDRVVVISDGLWRTRYGANPAIAGTSIMINGEPFVIIGVAAPSLLVPTSAQLHALIPFAARIDIFKPIAPTPQALNNESWDHGVLVRLAAGAPIERGRQQLHDVLSDLARAQMPGVKTDPIIELVPMRDIYAARVRPPLVLIVVAAVLLLVAACASIANVFLAKGAGRAAELSMRMALGASRGRIAMQLLTEAGLLALAGGAVGAMLAWYGTVLLSVSAPHDVRALSHAELSAPFFACALIVTMLTGIVCGVVPVVQASRRDPAGEIKDGARTAAPRAGRARQALAGVEMALATVLLATSALLLHSFVNVMTTDRGYAIEGVLTADLSLFGARYQSGEARGAFYGTLVDQIRALPGVTAAGAINNLPAVSATDGPSRTIFLPEDTNIQQLMLQRPVAIIRAVTTGYFAASGTPLRAGRPFADTEPGLVAIVSESLAGLLWPGVPRAEVVGRRLRQSANLSSPLMDVIGVVADAKAGGLDVDPTAALYRPYAQWASGPMTLVVRTNQDPAALADGVKREIRRLDANLPIASMRTMREVVGSAVAQRRFQMTLTSLFAIVALLLGVVGVYGVTNYAVASRTKEIGVRLALGADRSEVLHWTFAIGMRPVIAGGAIGLLIALLSAKALRAALFGITAFDPVSFSAVAVILLATGASACYLPARRASLVDPIQALRHD